MGADAGRNHFATERMIVEQRDVEFEVEGGDRLRGWLFVPENKSAQHPAISMAHVKTGSNVSPGLYRGRVLVHEHRNFGSPGASSPTATGHLPPRNPARSRCGPDRRLGHELYRWARARPRRDRPRRIRAVVAQVPTISGYQQGLRRVPPDAVTALEPSSMTMSGRTFAASRPAASWSLAMIRRCRHPIDRGTPFPSISDRCRRVPG
jgi:uncharacterized protein